MGAGDFKVKLTAEVIADLTSYGHCTIAICMKMGKSKSIVDIIAIKKLRVKL